MWFRQLRLLTYLNKGMSDLVQLIGRMLEDVLQFMGLFSVILFGFSASFQYLISERDVASSSRAGDEQCEDILSQLDHLHLAMPFLFGAMLTGDVGGAMACVRDTPNNVICAALFYLFLVLSVLLLLNMIIAMMGRTFSAFEERASQESAVYFARVVADWYDQKTQPPPFNLLILLGLPLHSLYGLVRAQLDGAGSGGGGARSAAARSAAARSAAARCGGATAAAQSAARRSRRAAAPRRAQHVVAARHRPPRVARASAARGRPPRDRELEGDGAGPLALARRPHRLHRRLAAEYVWRVGDDRVPHRACRDDPHRRDRVAGGGHAREDRRRPAAAHARPRRERRAAPADLGIGGSPSRPIARKAKSGRRISAPAPSDASSTSTATAPVGTTYDA